MLKSKAPARPRPIRFPLVARRAAFADSAITESAVMRPVFGFSEGIFSIDIENRAEFGIDLDAMHVAPQCGIGPDLEPGPVGTDAGERQRDRDIQVGRKALGGLPRRAVENLQRLLDAFDVDVVLDQKRRTGETLNRLCASPSAPNELRRLPPPSPHRGRSARPSAPRSVRRFAAPDRSGPRSRVTRRR